MRLSPGSLKVQVLLEAEAIGVKAEAVEEIAASTSLLVTISWFGPFPSVPFKS